MRALSATFAMTVITALACGGSPAVDDRVPPMPFDLLDAMRADTPAPLGEALLAAREDFFRADNEEQLADAWRAVLKLAPTLDELLQAKFDTLDGEPVRFAWLEHAVPGGKVGYAAEGTQATLELDAAPWQHAATVTPEPVDDLFFAVLQSAYGGAREAHWPSWLHRTWDYGGCSAFGSGDVLQLLLDIDAARVGSPFKAELDELRVRVFHPVLTTSATFPYCDAATLQPRSDADLRAEAQGILDRANLSADERAQVEARLPALVGGPHTGG